MSDYDDLIAVVRKRRSVRRFAQGQSVPRETLLRIAEAARWAPTVPTRNASTL